MLSKALSLLCLLGITISQETTPATPTSMEKNSGPTTLRDELATAQNKLQNTSCTTVRNEIGECVPYSMCKYNNKDESGLIDLLHTYHDPCASISSLNVCCRLADKVNPVTPKPESEEQAKRNGCGWSNLNGAVGSVGGLDRETKFAEFPWMCAVFKIETVNDSIAETQNNVPIGGGSLIHPSVVLTAAHHVATTLQLRVRTGEWDTQSIKEPQPYQEREVASVRVHEDYNNGNLFYDIAVLFLSKPVELAPNVGLACLPPPRQRVPPGTRCFATGWGKDETGKKGQHQIDVPVVDRADCQTRLRMTRLGRFFELHTSFMCAGGEPGKDTCKGDGGSPLSCPVEFEEGRYMQSGIVAWGIGCGEDGTPGVYVDVSNLRSWVDDKVAGKGYDPKTYSF